MKIVVISPFNLLANKLLFIIFFFVFIFNNLIALICLTLTSDALITSYHQSMTKTISGFVTLGEDMVANRADTLLVTEIIPANGYNYTGTSIHVAVSENTHVQAFLATTISLYAWGTIVEVVSSDFTTSEGLNDMNSTQNLPFTAVNIIQLHAGSDVLFVVPSGQIWIATTGTTDPTGNDNNNVTIWQQLQTSIGIPLTGIADITSNKYVG